MNQSETTLGRCGTMNQSETTLGRCEGVVSWVAKFKEDINSECKLSNGRSRSCKVIKLLLSAGKGVVAKLQGDKSAPRSSMEFYCP